MFSVKFIVLALDWNINIFPCHSKIAINQVKINLKCWFTPFTLDFMHFLAILTLIFAFSIKGCFFFLFFCLLKKLEFHFPKGDPTQIFFSENWSKSVFWLILSQKNFRPIFLRGTPAQFFFLKKGKMANS